MKYLVFALTGLVLITHINACDSGKPFSFNDIDTQSFPYIWKKSISYGDFYHKSETPQPEPTHGQIMAVSNHPLCKCIAERCSKNGTYDIEKLNELDSICAKLAIKPSEKETFLDSFFPQPSESPEVQTLHQKAMALRNCIGVLKIAYHTRSNPELINQIDTMLSHT